MVNTETLPRHPAANGLFVRVSFRRCSLFWSTPIFPRAPTSTWILCEDWTSHRPTMTQLHRQLKMTLKFQRGRSQRNLSHRHSRPPQRELPASAHVMSYATLCRVTLPQYLP